MLARKARLLRWSGNHFDTLVGRYTSALTSWHVRTLVHWHSKQAGPLVPWRTNHAATFLILPSNFSILVDLRNFFRISAKPPKLQTHTTGCWFSLPDQVPVCNCFFHYQNKNMPIIILLTYNAERMTGHQTKKNKQIYNVNITIYDPYSTSIHLQAFVKGLCWKKNGANIYALLGSALNNVISDS